MLIIARTDFIGYRVPDLISLPSIPLGLVTSAALAPQGDALATATRHTVAALIAILALWGIRTSYRCLRHREGLGLGDVKLAAVAGAWVGLEALPHVLLLACGLALLGLTFAQVVLHRELTATSTVPFGAALAPAIWIAWFLMVATV
jgi:leader peptidase (prepilin peptidase)/N-methyltransferase